MRNVTINVQLVATEELIEASKRKVDILADQNVLMLFIALDNGNMNEYSR
jgi:hypothetical protein